MIATTRSTYAVFSAAAAPPSRPFRSRRSPPPAPLPRRWGPAIGLPLSFSASYAAPRHKAASATGGSELEPGFAGGVGQGGDATGVPAATTVEHNGLDTCGLGALGDECADLARLRRLVFALVTADRGVQGR